MNETTEILKTNLRLLRKSVRHLKYSHHQAKSISLQEDNTEDQLETLDALASRFGRTVDLFFKKVLRSVLTVLEEFPKLVIDQANRAEQLHLIHSASELLEMRRLRNQITHEYTDDQWVDLYDKIISFVPGLIRSIEMTEHFVAQQFQILNEEE